MNIKALLGPQRNDRARGRVQRGLLFALFALSPLAMAPRGCDTGVVGDDTCPDEECALTGGDTCGGLQGAQCDQGEYCDFPADALCGAADATGTCKPVPEVCDDIYAPVCGCDDRTYSNDCEANAAGVSVASDGECGGPDPGGSDCGGLAGLACGDGEYCDFPAGAHCGAADMTGTCKVIPDICTLIDAPVCGCDDQTYSNACAANREGVSVAYEGECQTDPGPGPGPGGDVCGGIAGLACDKGEFCNYPPEAQCGAGDMTGVCMELPTACTFEYSPVCGCDGVTYGNQCAAFSQGVSVVHPGECSPPGGTVCGGLLGTQCAEGEYCKYPEDAGCGYADQTGTCEARPDACDLNYAPVCGCDGKTYGNDCEAASAGVSVASEGECP